MKQKKKNSGGSSSGSAGGEFALNPNSKFDFKYVEMAARLKACGFSHADVGYAFGVSQSTITTWSNKYEQFYKALNDGKSIAISRLVAKAFRAAAGYEYEEENNKYDKKGDLVSRSVFKKQMPANAKLVMWLLCNLSPDDWKSEHKITVAKDETIIVKLDGKIASRQIEALAGKLFNPVVKKKVIIEAGASSNSVETSEEN